MILTPQQKDVIRSVLKDVDNEVSIKIGGYAGSGKSTIIKWLAEAKKTSNFCICAYTGKAANVLRRKGMGKASTIHRAIYRPYEQQDGSVEFALVKPWEFCFDGFIVDEASMVSEEIYYDLLTFQKPIIFIGDHGQLEPVNSKFNIMAEPKYRLEEVIRNAGEIAHFAEHIRKGGQVETFETSGAVQIGNIDEASDEILLGTDQIICAYNKTRVGFNQRIRDALGYKKLIEDGERVMCLNNRNNVGVFNGMQGVVRNMDRDTFDFDTDGNYIPYVRYSREAFGKEKFEVKGRSPVIPFEYAYCITCHKCVAGDTLVETDSGLARIDRIAKSGVIATPSGPRPYQNKVRNPVGPALRMTTERGYQITMTPDHRMEVWDGTQFVCVKARQAVIGQFVRLRTKVVFEPESLPELADGVPGQLSDDVAEFLGLMVAYGTVFDTGFRLVKRHRGVEFSNMVRSLFPGAKPREISVSGTPGIEVSSVLLAGWLRIMGGMSPNDKHIPDCVLRSSLRTQRAFLRGLFDNDAVDKKCGYIQFSHAPKMLRQVQSMLLRGGVISVIIGKTLYIDDANTVRFGKWGQKNLRSSTVKDYTVIPVADDEVASLKSGLTSTDYNNVRQRGYISRIKAAGCSSEFLRERGDGWHYERIATLEPTTCESYCVEVPDGHRFLQNGFPFWNSQGDEWANVIVLEQHCKNWDHIRWAYTAASRAKTGLIWLRERRYR